MTKPRFSAAIGSDALPSRALSSPAIEASNPNEAVARVRFCVAESLLGVIVGEVGVGKTVALRAAVHGLDPTAHQVIYVANPAFGTRIESASAFN